MTGIVGKTSSAKQDDDSRELWEKTLKEADGRLLRGPFSVAEVDEIFSWWLDSCETLWCSAELRETT